MGRPFAEVFHAHPAIVRVLAGAYELAFLPNRAELRLTPSDKVLGYTLSLIRNAEGLTIGAAMFFKDLTRVEQLEERERLRDRLAVLGEMAAAVAHEIKNPLAGIEVMAGLLRRQLKDNEQATALVGDIINEAKMANAIVQEILDFVRPVRLQMERTSVAAAVQAAVTMADGKARRGDVQVTTALDDALPLIDADRTQLVQVFANLLINAYEALDGRGHVTISAREVHREEDGALPLDGLHPMPTVVVEVTDDGPGVPPELADKIFSAFFTTKAQGSGLGLAIVRKIVDAHDGRIDMTSRPGAGTKFRVALPVSGDARVW
jgi:signal transduction histidine kinase